MLQLQRHAEGICGIATRRDTQNFRTTLATQILPLLWPLHFSEFHQLPPLTQFQHLSHMRFRSASGTKAATIIPPPQRNRRPIPACGTLWLKWLSVVSFHYYYFYLPASLTFFPLKYPIFISQAIRIRCGTLISHAEAEERGCVTKLISFNVVWEFRHGTECIV